MEQGAPPADPLRAFLSGKREHKRHAVSLPIELVGQQWEFSGRCIDVSDGGALLALPEISLDRALADGDDDYLSVLHRELSTGFDIRFVHNGVVVESELVRLSTAAGQSGLLYLGCRFQHALAPTQRLRLGVDASGGPGGAVDAPWLEAAPLERLPLEPRPGRMASALIFDGSPVLAGPRFAAEAIGLGDRALAVRIPGVDPSEVTMCLGTLGFEFHLVSGGKAVWTGQASLVAARYLDTPEGGVELVMLADSRPPRAARALFTKRR